MFSMQSRYIDTCSTSTVQSEKTYSTRKIKANHCIVNHSHFCALLVFPSSALNIHIYAFSLFLSFPSCYSSALWYMLLIGIYASQFLKLLLSKLPFVLQFALGRWVYVSRISNNSIWILLELKPLPFLSFCWEIWEGILPLQKK